MIDSVAAALRGFGSLKFGTAFEMASTPVNEDEPLENARKNNKIVILDDDVPIAAAAWKAT